MRIELLYFEGCPSHKRLQPRLERLLREAGVAVPVELRRVDSPEAAEAEHFLGSPTLRVNDEDVEPGAGERSDYGLKCRLYRPDEGVSGLPPDEWIKTALERAKRQVVAHE